MERLEYKTVALPQMVRGKKKRRQSTAEMVAETLGRTINKHSTDGWTYLRAESMRGEETQGFLFRKSVEVTYTVLIFVRPAPTRATRMRDESSSVSVADADDLVAVTPVDEDHEPIVPPIAPSGAPAAPASAAPESAKS